MNKLALIIDDDRTERRLIAKILKNVVDFGCIEAENGKDALRILGNNDIALIILDLDMPVMGGLETLEHIKAQYPAIPVIVLTGSTNTEDSALALNIGAVDFLSKPVESARLDVSAKNALKMAIMSQEISRLKRHSQDAFCFADLIGFDGGLKESVKMGRKAATCDLPVLVTGETGTGKEIFSKAIHGESNRFGHPFVAVNCGAIPEKLVESTLFGHEKGAFTGAVNKALGKFQEATGGTIFLDEIGELPLEAQVKLLRAIQQKEVEPVGAARAVPVDVRIISATNRDLLQAVKDGNFREDLYFRLNVLHIKLPPLRARKEDIPVMAQYFIKKFCAGHQTIPKEISTSAIIKLQNHIWPGNVRELENVINRTLALSDDNVIKPQNFSFVDAVGDRGLEQRDNVINPLNEDGTFKSFRDIEQEIIALALTHHAGNMSQTARVLGIAKSTLYTKLENLADKRSA